MLHGKTIDDVNSDEYDDLKKQALDFGKDVVEELSVINDNLVFVLDLADDNDDDDWTFESPLESSTSAEIDATTKITHENYDDDKNDDEVELTDSEIEHLSPDAARAIEEKNVELEKNNEVLVDKVEELTELLRSTVENIEILSTAAEAFENEVENL